jgi:hypothetical protein
MRSMFATIEVATIEVGQELGQEVGPEFDQKYEHR